MIQPTFEVEETYLPVTMEQFESITNEIILELNKLSLPHAIDAEHAAKLVMGSFHGMPKEVGSFKKTDLFNRCVRMLSSQITYNIIQAIQLKEEAERKKENPQTLTAVPDEVIEH